MTKYLFAVWGVLLGLSVAWGVEWELVYPEEYPLTEELPFHSIGNRNWNYMIGSRSGFVLLDYYDALSIDSNQLAFVSDRRIKLKLPVPFDIHAISSVNNQWILGGPRGQVAIHKAAPYLPNPMQQTPSNFDYLHLDWFLKGWEFHYLPTEWTIEKFAVLGHNILALAIEKERVGHSQLEREYELYSSHDKGETWTAVNEFLQVFDVAEFKGNLFALAVEEEGEKPYLSGPLGLFRSTNGRDWESIWKFQAPGFIRDTQLMVLGIEQFMDRGSIGEFPGDRRLFVQFNSGRFELSVSSSDGITWFNNGSSRLDSQPRRVGGGPGGPWNPLDLPDSDFIVPQPDWENLQQASGIYRIFEHQVEVLYDQQWIGGSSSFEETAIPVDTVAPWDNLTFAYGLSNIVSVIDKEIISYPAPDFADGIVSFDQLIAAGGIHYAVVRTDQFPFYRFGRTADLENWHRLPPPDESNSFRLFSKGSTVAAFYSPFIATMDNPIKAISVWDGHWGDPNFILSTALDVAYVPSTMTSYTINSSNGRASPESNVVKIAKLDEDGHQYLPEVWRNGSYKRLSCPDGENLVAYGDSAEVAFIQTDGTVRMSHPWQYFALSEYRIDSVKFVNGWYYLLGKVAIRTKDFVDYEWVPLPLDQPLTNVVGFGDHLYGFVSGAVYRQPMEKGFLDSIIRDQGWRHSRWLGWFQIIDEQKGDIDHLLLGECWVKPTNERDFWIRTETLGWIYIYKDWSPWLWRMDDGHWYWLDQDGWPPRAWDYEDQEWVELKP